MIGTRRESRRFLLIGSPPTPNGRAHLGHVAGPFLRLDVLARHCSVRGDDAVLLSGSDGYDMYVLLSARRESVSPEEVATRFHAAMAADLRAMDIALAAFVDPRLPPWAQPYESILHDTIAALSATGRTAVRRERVLYANTTGRAIVGCWLLGRCPACGAEVGGYFCEGCGGFFRPELLNDPHPRFEEGPLEWRNVAIKYLEGSPPKRLLETWEAMGIGAAFRSAGKRYVAAHGSSFPLSQPGSWGIPAQTSTPSDDHVIFSYGALYPYLRLLGAVYGSITGRTVNPFDAASGVTTVVAFGIDNLIPYLVPTIAVALDQPNQRPCDHYLINYFYELEGAKFSTSRGHVIWGKDIAVTPAGSDAVRCYIARVNPEHGPASFDIDDFIAFTNTFLVARLDTIVQRRWLEAAPASPGAPPMPLVGRLEDLLKERDARLDPRAFNLSGSLDQLDKWLKLEAEIGGGGAAAYWWLKGFSLLAYPLLPKLGLAAWSALGHPETPSTVTFAEKTSPVATANLPRFRRLRAADLASCLPETLRALPVG